MNDMSAARDAREARANLTVRQLRAVLYDSEKALFEAIVARAATAQQEAERDA